MDKEILQFELDLLLADKLINSEYLDNTKCINWAVSLMERGVNSGYVDILAGLGVNDSFAVEDYFQKLIDELDLNGNKKSTELFQLYVIDISQKVIAGRLSPDQGLEIFSNIIYYEDNCDFSTELIKPFSALSESISLMDEYQLFYTNLTKESKDEAILNEMKMLLFRISKDLASDLNLIYCNTCNDFTPIATNQKGWLFKTEEIVCNKCKSTNFISWNNVLNQKRILDLLIGRQN